MTSNLDPADLKTRFRPEFLNRVDETLIFGSLDEKHLRRIVDIQLAAVQKRLAERRIALSLSDAAKDQLAREGYDPAYGARPLKRTIQKRVVDPLARLLLTGEVKDGDTIAADKGSDGLSFKSVKKKESKTA
jgi:ATP-dependent Clp protease ATP-binding subunit ClpB